jgi:2'-hydroxyisoflavone reductase
MRLLVLGGSVFAGHAIIREALGWGWDVTVFNRGLSGSDVDGVAVVRGDRADRADLARLARAGSWDVAVDTSGYVPQETLAVAGHLEPVVGRYVFVSTVSVYRDWPREPLTELSEVLYCPPDAGSGYGTDTEDGPTRYGYQKSGCELAVRQTFGTDRTVILRPGVVLGPRETVGRLPWWLRRITEGGDVLAPGSPDRSIQPVDVRDLAVFVIRVAERGLADTYNVTAPVGRETFGSMLHACAHVTASTATFTWVPDEVLLAEGVRQWSEIPLWRTYPGVWHVDAEPARAVGLSCRPLAETVTDTWSWMLATGSQASDARAAEIGMSRARERQILASLT